jgi:hypothetical protein
MLASLDDLVVFFSHVTVSVSPYVSAKVISNPDRDSRHKLIMNLLPQFTRPVVFEHAPSPSS